MLEKSAPELWEIHKGLLDLAKEGTAAENTWLEAQAAYGRAFGEELIARAAVMRQLQKNEGSLLILFPGQKAKARAFFRQAKKTKKAAAEEPVG